MAKQKTSKNNTSVKNPLNQITVKKSLNQTILEEQRKSEIRNKMLNYFNSGIWEGNLQEMRTMR